MKSPFLVLIMVIVVLSTTSVVSAGTKPDLSSGDQDIATLLQAIRKKYKVPAIAGAIVSTKGSVSVGVVGVRKKGTEIAVTLEDQWHLGSDTKAMTATLIAKMVEQGQLKWETTMAEVFPKLSPGFHDDMKKVTVLQLLCHRAGLPANLKLEKYLGESKVERLKAVKQELANPPKTPPGSHFLYSNLGYIIAGAVVEKVTGKSWEKNMTEHLFKPLKMKHVGFGGLGTPGKIDQPWSHTSLGFPVAKNGPTVDNPPVMGPAGRVHCTIQDWAKFVADQLRGARGESTILKNSSYKILQTPAAGGDYALGWISVKRGWAGGAVLTHAGSNSMNYAVVWIIPKRGFAVLVCINQGGNVAKKASDDAVRALIAFQMKKIEAARKKKSSNR